MFVFAYFRKFLWADMPLHIQVGTADRLLG